MTITLLVQHSNCHYSQLSNQGQMRQLSHLRQARLLFSPIPANPTSSSSTDEAPPMATHKKLFTDLFSLFMLLFSGQFTYLFSLFT